MSRTTKKILAEDMGLTTKGVTVSVSEQIEELDREDRAEFYSKASEFANRIYKQYRMFSTTVLSSAYVRLNILGCSSSEMPMPVSLISTRTNIS